MKYYGKAQEAVDKVLEAFNEPEKLAPALGQVFFQTEIDIPCHNWSLMNRFMVILSGSQDCRGYKQWKSVGRHVKKGAKAVYILAPVFGKKTIAVDKNDITENDKTKYVNGELHKLVDILIGFRAAPVFRYEDTEGKELKDPNSKAINALPFINVAKQWGLTVKTVKNNNLVLGAYIPASEEINLAVENLSTWTHELIHAAEDRLGNLNLDDRKACEVVAELGGASLLVLIGLEKEADLGGAYEYIKSWSNNNTQDACMKVINRILQAIELIVEESKK